MVWALIFKEIRKREAISQEQLAGILEVSRGNIAQIERGVNQPSLPLLFRLIKKFSLNANILSPLLEADEKQASQLLPQLFGQETGLPEKKPALNHPPIDSEGEVVRIPMVEIDVAAGGGSYNPDYLSEIDAVFLPHSLLKGRKKQQYLAVRIHGESMSPTLLNKGLLIIHALERSEWRDIQNGGIYVVVDREGRSYVKRLQNRLGQGYLLLVSDNPDKLQYGDFSLDEADIHAVWQADGYFTTYMPDIHQQYYHRLTDLEADMNQMKSQLRRLANSIEKR